MRMRREEMARYIAPTYDPPSNNGNNVRIPLLYHVEDKIAGLGKWERLEHRQIFFLPCDSVECFMETLDVLRRCSGHLYLCLVDE